ncbi:uncharacterized protein PV09_05320 [Verruconis gallopava]|uniref:Uncharacterized protein n=1 Tax=Verruconis gallopava TaxID=253628 RepID=A0A0D1XM92_9PEZI|nr:uncharacterized protein PV09_05320 [Verruconis gallopava]KIW03561.1 hypothetical protein PV09_05320 [Verruconis gallopava]
MRASLATSMSSCIAESGLRDCLFCGATRHHCLFLLACQIELGLPPNQTLPRAKIFPLLGVAVCSSRRTAFAFKKSLWSRRLCSLWLRSPTSSRYTFCSVELVRSCASPLLANSATRSGCQMIRLPRPYSP